ncbi:DNA-processing protein DprA [Herbiconiux liangxiaofengii]|uniref:DNA-processing protein DprA n=1 Tax=Herbiconiux liangxiaofengii TaxID=3342795 RepID=UPI0035B73AE7
MTTVYELDRALVRDLTSAVAPTPGEGERHEVSEHDDVQAARMFASAAWSTLAEPGDATAGHVTAALGADRALSLLIESRTVPEWVAALREPSEVDARGSGASEIDEREVSSALERWRPRLASRTVVASLRSAARIEARLLVPGTPDWPPVFDDLGPHAPLALWVRGSLRALAHPAGLVAIVGSRDATNYGEHVAMELASGLTDRGFAIVSGAAYGIDGMAHRAALVSGGITVAYLAGGVDRLYPAAHHDLLLRVAASGAIVSELPCGTAPTKWRFLQRNRLIAAASQATVVVEAGRRSGSLNTAGHAAALGRPLGAVPGPITSSTSAGCHRLLREYDATCVTSAADVVELVLGPSGSDPAPPLFDFEAVLHPAGASTPPPAAPSASSAVIMPGAERATAPTSSEVSPPASASVIEVVAAPVGAAANGDAVRVLDAMSKRTARSADDIATRSGMSPRAVAATLGVLLLDEVVRENAKGWVKR